MALSVDTQVPVLASELDRVWTTIRRTIPKFGTQRPEIGLPDLTYKRSDDRNWVDGFWSGQLWLAYAETGDRTFFDAARQQRAYFMSRLAQTDTHDHDLGFLYSLSAVADFKLTGDSSARAMGIAAAESLASRFNSRGPFIRAWNDWSSDTLHRNRGRMIIDCMENLSLLLWAAEETGDTRFHDVAVAHASTAADHLVRADGSTFHAFDFNPDTGAPIGGRTHQGYADDSCWSRGQAWAIHGFAQVYRYTGIEHFRTTAQRLADYALAHLPEDFVPYWDYCLPFDAPHYRDSSAAAITAAGLFSLADQVDAPTADTYNATAYAILAHLIADYTTPSLHAEGLLLHGAAHVREGLSDTLLPYGDYFYAEALLRANGRQAFFW